MNIHVAVSALVLAAVAQQRGAQEEEECGCKLCAHAHTAARAAAGIRAAGRSHADALAQPLLCGPAAAEAGPCRCSCWSVAPWSPTHRRPLPTRQPLPARALLHWPHMKCNRRVQFVDALVLSPQAVNWGKTEQRVMWRHSNATSVTSVVAVVRTTSSDALRESVQS